MFAAGIAGVSVAFALAAASPAGMVPNDRVFDRAWTLVSRHYWDKSKLGADWSAARAGYRAQAAAAPDTRRLYAILNAMLDRFGDSHVYATSRETIALARAAAHSHSEAGFGFDAVLGGGQWLIRAVDAAGPAAAAGMQIGWQLVSVAGQPVDPDRHFGEGETATLLLRDENGGLHGMTLRGVSLEPSPSRRAARLPGGLLALAFDQFGAGDDRWLAAQLAATPTPAGVILDLRENDGGDAAVLDRVAGRFVLRRRVILRLISRHTQDETTVGAGSHSYGGPLAVLVGPRTASAAEALAAFLDEDKRACSVGETSAGELTAGVDHRLPDGGRLTVSEYDIRTAGGTRLEGKGFTPRFLVRATLAQLRAGADPVRDEATALIRRGACVDGSGGGT